MSGEEERLLDRVARRMRWKSISCFAGTAARRCLMLSANDGVQRLFGVIELDHVHELRFGGPSDEGLSEHRLYGRGLTPYAAHEVFGDSSPGRQFLFAFHDSIVEARAASIENRIIRSTFAEVLVEAAANLAR